MLEVRAKTDAAAAAGQAIIQGFLTEPDKGTVYRSPLLCSYPSLYCTGWICCIADALWLSQRRSLVPNLSSIEWTHMQLT